ncbi:MAG TPA: SIMPL domain-containing protein, partial [Candidatus Baltobacteraceae bacterium]|nr:SIMPL domain-containing protein [Candidatus Baltobacteraceae bacterium]
MKLFVIAAVVFCLAAAPTEARAATQLSVTGTGSVVLPPDVATVSAVVETTSDSASDAASQNNVRYDRVVAALERIGIARSDVTLSGYNVNYNPKPQTLPPTPTGERYGYTVSRSFSVKVRQIGKAGSVVDACTTAGATGINGVSFGLQHPDAARARATIQAVADARAKADELARAARLHVVGIKSLDLGGGPGPQPMLRMAANAVTPATQFDQSNVNVTVNVNA